ncbi:MAG: hypothetical protein AAF404_16760 [Pseudomonadota bacterium]
MPMKSGPLSRLSLLALVTAGMLTLNLHGCGQYYRDNAQHDWLVNFEKFSTETAAAAKSTTARYESFSGTVSTTLSGRLQDPHLGELSGLARAEQHDDVLWAINDSGNPSLLYAITPTGKVTGRHVLPFKNRDWESLDSFSINGQSWLLVADTGDNLKRHQFSTLYFVPEPDSITTGKSTKLNRKQIKVVRFQYQGGPQNVEAVAVSVADNAIYLIAKNAATPALFSLPLDTAMNADSAMVATNVGQIHPLSFTRNDRAIERLLAGRLLLGPTGLDISSDEQLAVVSNYRHVYLFRKQQGENWADALQHKPAIIATHRMAQSESVAFGADATVVVGSEGMQAPLLVIDGNYTGVD